MRSYAAFRLKIIGFKSYSKTTHHIVGDIQNFQKRWLINNNPDGDSQNDQSRQL